MSAEKLGKRGLFVSGAYVEYVGQVDPFSGVSDLEAKFRSLHIQMRIQMHLEEAHTAAREGVAKQNARRINPA